MVDVGESKCRLFCLATLRFTNKSHRIRSSRSSYFEVRINFSVLVRSSFNFLAGKRNTSGERYTSGRRDLSRTSSRSNVTRNVTSTSNVTVKQLFTSGARRCLECEKIHDVDVENVYRTCIGGSTRVQDVHQWIHSCTGRAQSGEDLIWCRSTCGTRS